MIPSISANAKRSPKVGSMLAQRHRRWASIELAFGEHLVLEVLPAFKDIGYIIFCIVLGHHQILRWIRNSLMTPV